MRAIYHTMRLPENDEPCSCLKPQASNHLSLSRNLINSPLVDSHDMGHTILLGSQGPHWQSTTQISSKSRAR